MASRSRCTGPYVCISDCVVCQNTLKEPRILLCGHRYCFQCLETIAATHPQSYIKCPVCRIITQMTTGDLVKCKVHEFQTKVNRYLSGQVTQPERACSYCEGLRYATKSCYECKLVFCDECEERHTLAEVLFHHKISTISKHQFCTSHPTMFILGICKQCNVYLCPLCMGAHSSHELEDIHIAGTRARQRLSQDIIQNLTFDTDIKIKDSLANALETVKAQQASFHMTISKARHNLKDLEKKLDTIELETNQRLKSEIMDLEIMEWDLTEFIRAKENFLNYISTLAQNACDAEVFTRAEELPKYASANFHDTIDKSYYCSPLLCDLEEVVEHLDSIKDYMSVKFIEHQLYDTPLSTLELQGEFNVKDGQINGMIFDLKERTLAFRTGDAAAPVKIYSPAGTHLKNIGGSIQHLSKGTFNDISIDTSNNCFLLPMEDGSLITMDKDGRKINSIQVTNTPLNGISYGPLGDYATSSVSEHIVFQVDPLSKEKKSDFTPNTTFKGPYNITCCRNKSLLYVSDYLHHCVKCLQMDGRVVNIYGVEKCPGHQDGELRTPRSICFGPGNQLIVSDNGNRRIVSFQTGDDQGPFMTLVAAVDLKTKQAPQFVTCDPVHRTLFVAFNNGVTYIFKEKKV